MAEEYDIKLDYARWLMEGRAASKDKWQKLRDEIWQLHSEGCAALHPLIVLSFMDIFEKEEQSSR